MGVTSDIPNDEKVKSCVRYLKRKLHSKDPRTLSDFTVKTDDLLTYDGEPFLLADNNDINGKRIIIFATKHNVKCLLKT